MRRVAQKKKCLQHRALIVAWLRVNYCLRESGTIAKCEVFHHYTELCQANKIQPSSAAAFGKILKMAFPTVKCNRVGPRGASKHHYRGLVLKDDYQLSLANVEPLSEAAITQLMKEEAEAEAANNQAQRGKMRGGRRRRGPDDDGDEDEDHHDDDDDEEEDDDYGGDEGSQQGDRRTMMMTEASTSTASPQPLSSSTSSTSPHTSSPMSRPPAAHQHHPYALQQPQRPLDHPQPQPHPYPGAGYLGGHPPQLTAAYMLPPPHPQLQSPHYHHHQAETGQTAAATTKESFSWISPDMDYPARRPAPWAPLAAQVQAQSPMLPMPLNDAALREWAEKRDLVEFCERNFQALYDNVHRTLSGGGGGHESREQVLTSIADAWKNLRQYTRHMHLFPEPATSSAPPISPMSTTTTATATTSAERITDCQAPTPPPTHHHQPPTLTQPPSAMNMTAPPFSHFAMMPLPPSYYARAGTPPPLSGSSLSLSWLANSLAMSMGNGGTASSHQRATSPTAPPAPHSHTIPGYHHPQPQQPPGPPGNGRGGTGDGGEGSSGPDRGTLAFRSFEWKGVYE